MRECVVAAEPERLRSLSFSSKAGRDLWDVTERRRILVNTCIFGSAVSRTALDHRVRDEVRFSSVVVYGDHEPPSMAVLSDEIRSAGRMSRNELRVEPEVVEQSLLWPLPQAKAPGRASCTLSTMGVSLPYRLPGSLSYSLPLWSLNVYTRVSASYDIRFIPSGSL